MNGENSGKNSKGKGWRWLLALPFVGLIWTPFYNSVEPSLWGIPFFYWYQFLWVFLTPALTWLVFRKTD